MAIETVPHPQERGTYLPLSPVAGALMHLWQSAMDAITNTKTGDAGEGIDEVISILDAMRPLIASSPEQCQPLASAPFAAPGPDTQAAGAESDDYPPSYDLFVAEVVDRITDLDAMIAGAAAIAEEGERVNYAAILLRDLIPEKTESLRNWIDMSGPRYR